MSTHRDEWLATAGHDLPLDAATLFPEGDGFLERRRAARRAGQVAKLRPVLSRLEPGEVVRYVALGAYHKLAEAYFTGYWVSYQTNLTALVLTDRRLLLVHCRSSGAPRDVKNQVRLDQLREVKPRGLFSGATLLLADGAKLFYQGLPKADAQRLAALVAAARGASPGPAVAPPGAPASLEHLCPSCLAQVPGPAASARACPRPECRIPFRDARRAARLSAVVPGMGDLYLRHHLFGAWEFVVSIALLCFAVFLIADAATGQATVIAGVVGLLFVVLPRVIDYFLTLHMGKKGYIALADRPAPGGDVRNLPAFPRWAMALFAVGAIAVLGTAAGAIGHAGERRVVRRAMEAATAARFDEALTAWGEAEAKQVADKEDLADLVLALLRAGDVLDAERLMAGLAGVQIEDAKAKEIDASYERYSQAFGRYERGIRALGERDDEAAWKELDPAFPVLRTVKRPAVPATRAEAALELAEGVLAGPEQPTSEHVAAVTHLVELGKGGGARLALVEARVAAASGEGDAARAKLAVRGARLGGPNWSLLELETRLAIAKDATEAAAVAAEAKALGELEEGLAARRDAVVEGAAGFGK
ncbi:MAG: hypothetical protein QM704_14590 [Anaeromyxobacteraceae bacterium]